LGTSIDSDGAKAAKLKEEAASLQQGLGELAASQREMDNIRSEEKALYTKNQAEMSAGVAGIQKALSVLKDYYSKKTSGAGNGLISMLEVVESDFTKGLTEIEASESSAAAEYDKTTQMNKFSKASKEKDLEYKGKEAVSLDKAAAESTSDKEGVQAELDALLEYLAKLNKMCIAKAEPYAERVARREAELAGLKQALTILDGEASLLQRNTKRAFRGAH